MTSRNLYVTRGLLLPNGTLVSAAVLEIAIGAICVADLVYLRRSGDRQSWTARGGWSVAGEEGAA